MFFDIFFELCKRKGVSCKRAAEDIGLSNSITTKWKKTGATPSGETLNKIAQYFGVTIDYLLSKEQNAAQAKSGKGDVVDEVDMAFYGEYKELSEDDKEIVRDMVAAMRQRRGKKQE